jgi:hypothetical protein
MRFITKIMPQRGLSGLGLALLLLLSAGFAQAQALSEQDVIDFAANNPPFSMALGDRDWTASAFDTGNRYGVWRVQFWDAEGNDLGIADVQPARQRIYSAEFTGEATQSQLDTAEPIIREFVYDAPELKEFVPDLRTFAESIYIGYNHWEDGWGVYIYTGSDKDALYATVRFSCPEPECLEDPRIVRYGFPELASYDDWLNEQKSQVIMLSFLEAEVAAWTQDISDWRTEVERSEDGLWRVGYINNADESLLGVAIVDLSARAVVGTE